VAETEHDRDAGTAARPAPRRARAVDAKERADRAVYIISVAAELAGVHPQTLRIYERRGLIEPQRTPGGSRRYSDRDIRRLARIQELTTEGVSLVGVVRFLELEDRLDDAHRELERLRGEVDAARRERDAAVAETHRQYRRDLVPVSQSLVRYRRGS
jgi:MerR family transcriptional regulator/heat shock protein HspR